MPSPVEALKGECVEDEVNVATQISVKRMVTSTLSSHQDNTPNKQGQGRHLFGHYFKTPGTQTDMDYAQKIYSASPVLKTPSTCSSRGTPGSYTPGCKDFRKISPQFHTTPGGSSHQVVLNPFEGQFLDRLQSKSPMFSPNMFKVTEPGSEEKAPQLFRWSIDQVAILKPAAIEEKPLQQDTLNIMRHPHEEARVQEAIDMYFQAGNIVPSPWTDNVRKFVIPRTPDPSRERESSKTLLENLPLSGAKDKQEAECQTVLTIPVDFNLQNALGQYYTYTQNQQQAFMSVANSHPHDESPPEVEGQTADQAAAAAVMMAEAAASVAALFECHESPADLSTSSLRRKLFFHGDEGTPLSPVRSNKSRIGEMMDMSSPAVSPLRGHVSRQSHGSHAPTPASSHFSSSPIRGLEQTPSLRRSSTAPSMIGSPLISPIGGDFGPKGSQHGLGSPMCLPLEATPSSGHSVRHLHSPGFSPIHTGSAAGGQGGGDGSYVSSPSAERLPHTRSDSLRRRALIGQTEKHVTPPEDAHLSPFNLMAAHAHFKQRISPPFCSSPSPLVTRSSLVDLEGLEGAKCRIDFDQPIEFGTRTEPARGEMDMSCSGCEEQSESQNIYAQTHERRPYINEGSRNTDIIQEEDDGFDDNGDFNEDEDQTNIPPMFTAAFRDFRESCDYDGETTTGFQTLCSTTQEGIQSQDTGYQTQYSAINEATMSTNLTNHFSNLPATFESSKDNSPTSPEKGDFCKSVGQISEMPNGINHSGMTPSDKELNFERLAANRDEIFSKDKSKEQIFEELQLFANKFSDSTFESKIKAPPKTLIHDNRLHKSCSMGDFRSNVYKKSVKSSFHELQPKETLDIYTHEEVSPNTDRYNDTESKQATLCSIRSSYIGLQTNVENVKRVNFDFNVASQTVENEQMPLRPRTLSRSMSDFTCEDKPYTSVTQPLFGKNRSAHTNPAFIIETLLPNTDSLAQKSVTDPSKDALNLEKQHDCDLNQNVFQAKATRVLKSIPCERSGNIRPRLLFSDSKSDEMVVQSQHASDKQCDMDSSSLKSPTSIAHGFDRLSRWSCGRTKPEVTSKGNAHPPSPVSSLVGEQKVLMNAKRVLADQYISSEGRTKRRSPTLFADSGGLDNVNDPHALVPNKGRVNEINAENSVTSQSALVSSVTSQSNREQVFSMEYQSEDC